MKQNNFKAILFRMDWKKENVLYDKQIIEFIKKLGRADLKIGLLLPEKKPVSTTSEINPFVQAVHKIGVSPEETMALLTQPKDIESARDSGFNLIVGWETSKEKERGLFFKKGADIVIQRLSDLSAKWIDEWFNRYPPHLLESVKIFSGENENFFLHPRYFYSDSKIMEGKEKAIFFFDYDGTLTPIVQQPDLAKISPEMKEIIRQLSLKYKLAIVSGRGRRNLQTLVDLPGIFYAGDHGLDIMGPDISMIHPKVKKFLPLIQNISKSLDKSLSHIPGVIVEKKKMSAAIHYRQVSKEDLPGLKLPLKKILKENRENIRLLKGKKVVEFLPNIEWNKGKAVLWILNALRLDWSEHKIFYLGDDTTDEDAFRILRTRGTSILIAEKAEKSAADFRLSSPEEVKCWLKQFLN
ncbi:MAG: trehalose-phosphatase [Actinobacteria bacterium RBG_13_35_12]|uniref:Trehalose 6-phosphate phosphatase n=1 Tax=Candidatus Sediminicultor quintus TaxID=1797291 RepID=A0A1F5ABW1_9BACT|nr:MAG: trehalose-phosphatase [Actinobacteria bacterium RBG_13_35_12]OGD15394.1 MAG: trehalose-phosphatase [Candidatus Atribacteria bacterium RBG_19FT_COMBO_35_14]